MTSGFGVRSQCCEDPDQREYRPKSKRYERPATMGGDFNANKPIGIGGRYPTTDGSVRQQHSSPDGTEFEIGVRRARTVSRVDPIPPSPVS